jgi:glycosyltransferase involved in cell wall biosynthesis
VDSLLGVPDTEILLIDDGATDGSGKICDSYAELKLFHKENGSNTDRPLQNITVYHKPNGGLSNARNYGLEKAKGEWIIFIDGDDYVLPNSFRKFCEYLHSTEADVVCNDYYLHNVSTNRISEIKQIGMMLERSTNGEITTALARSSSIKLERFLRQKGNIYNVWRYAYRRKDLCFKTGYLAEDLDFITRLLAIPRLKIEFVHVPYYVYNFYRNGSIWERASLKLLHDVICLVRENYERLDKQQVELRQNQTESRRIVKLLKYKLLREYVLNAAKYYDFSKAERNEIKKMYQSWRFNPLPLAPLLWLARNARRKLQ